MSNEQVKQKDALSDLECLRAISVRNLPQDVNKELLQCLFPESSEIKLNVDRYGKCNRRSSIIIFPKVSNALYYADQDLSIKLDEDLLSIQSLVTADATSSKKEQAPPNSQNRGKESSHHDKDRSRGQQSDSSHSSGHPSSTPSHVRGGRRSMSPSHRRKYREDHSSRSLPHRDDHRSTLLLDDRDCDPFSPKDNHEFNTSDHERMILVKDVPVSMTRSTIFSLIPNSKKITIHHDESKEDALLSVVEFYTAKEAEVCFKRHKEEMLQQHSLTLEPYVIDAVGQEYQYRYVATKKKTTSIQKERQPPPQLLRGDRRSVFLTSTDGETFYYQQSGRYIGTVTPREHDKLSDKQRDQYDSNDAAVMTLHTLEKLISGTAWSNSDPLPAESRKSSRYKSEGHDVDDRFSPPLPGDNYYNSAETVGFQEDQKYVVIDYNHRKHADRTERSSSHSPYRKENYPHDRYDDTQDYRERPRRDYESGSPPRRRTRHNQREYDDAADPFDKSFRNDWQENPSWRNESGRRRDDPMEFGQMDHDDRIRSDEYERNRFPHDTDSRFNRMRDMSSEDGRFRSYRHNDSDGMTLMVDGEHYHDPDDYDEEDYDDAKDKDKPMGWRYYSLGMKTLRWK